MTSCVVNVYYLKINSISGNGSITIGEASHNSPTSNSKLQGTNSSFGDYSASDAMMENLLNDPDIMDQSGLGTVDATNILKEGSPVVPL
ncbi:spore germination protein [Bacillus sp. FJAT-27251]|uniref:spore germination protein n=1 Tax=Bacillus sp. FJAT-27251 TaxID=1684142 RepID=UPI0006A77F28|nr:spore germination protein [Bacillus sp. FJAT-27251]